MSRRERVEDLGRLYIMINELLNKDIFDFYPGRLNDFEDWFYKQSAHERSEILRALIYELDNIEGALLAMHSIAAGTDEDDAN